MLSKYDLIGVGVMLSPNPAGQVRFGCMLNCSRRSLRARFACVCSSFRAGVCVLAERCFFWRSRRVRDAGAGGGTGF